MKIQTLEQLGLILRETRVALNVPLADLAGMVGTSQTLLRRLEQGRATVALTKLFATLQELGIEVHLELPPLADGNIITMDSSTKRNKRARP